MLSLPLIIVLTAHSYFGQTTLVFALRQTSQTTPPEIAEANKLSQQVARLYNDDKYEEALLLAKRVLELREKSLSPDDPLIAASLNDLGKIYAAQMKYSEAESLHKRALRMLEKKFGVDSDHLTSTLELLAVLRFVQRDRSGAEKLYARALAISEKASGPDNVVTGRLLRGIGRFYERTDRFEKAVESYARSLSILEKTLGSKNEEVGAVLHNYACALTESGKPEEAKSYRERAESILGRREPIKSPVLQGKAIKRVEPSYPPAARQSGISGTVVVQVIVDECGRVLSTSILTGPPALRDAAAGAAKGWHFTPTTIAGRPVKVIGTISFNFNL